MRLWKGTTGSRTSRSWRRRDRLVLAISSLCWVFSLDPAGAQQVQVARADGSAVVLSAGSEACVAVGMQGRICTLEIVHGKTVPACFAAIQVIDVGNGSARAQVVGGDAPKIRPGNSVEIPSLPATCTPPRREPPPTPTPRPTATPPPADPRPLLERARQLAGGGSHSEALKVFERVLREYSGSEAASEAALGVKACQLAIAKRTCLPPKSISKAEQSAEEANLARRALDDGQPARALMRAQAALGLDSCNPVALELKEEAARLLPPPEVWTDKELGLRYRLIPSSNATFTMGCANADSICAPDESPAHPVRLSKIFYLAETETTREQYERCIVAGACRRLGPLPAGAVPESVHPAAGVPWEEAKKFCAWADARLPTEAEWEFAAKGGTEGRAYSTGNAISRDAANYGAARCCSGVADGADRYPTVAPVASFSSGAFGLFDMAGNVAEWTSDKYGSYLPGTATDPKGPPSGPLVVTRGGSWVHPPERLRSSDRQPLDPNLALATVGFRCARDEVPKY